MGDPGCACPPSIALPLKRVELRVKARRDLRRRHRQPKGRVVVESHNLGRCGGQAVCRCVLGYGRQSVGLDLLVGAEAGAAVVRRAVSRERRWRNAVEPWHGGDAQGRIKINVGDADAWGDARVLDDDIPVVAVVELAENALLLGRKVEAEALEALGLWLDGDEEFLGRDELGARGRRDGNQDAGPAAVDGEDARAHERVGAAAEVGEGLVVEALEVEVRARDRGRGEPDKGVDRRLGKVLEHVQRCRGQDVTHALHEAKGHVGNGREVVLGEEVAKRKKEVGRDGVWQVVSADKEGVLRDLGFVALYGREDGGRVCPGDGRRQSDVLRVRPEVGEGAHVTTRVAGQIHQRLLKEGKVVAHDAGVEQGDNAVVERGPRRRVAKRVDMAAQPGVFLNQNHRVAGALEVHGRKGAARTTANDGDISGEDGAGGEGARVDRCRAAGAGHQGQ